MHLRAVMIAFAALAVVSSSAGAQNYPSRPITIVVPYAAGGGSGQVVHWL